MSWEGCAFHSLGCGIYSNFLLFANLWFPDVFCHVCALFEKFKNFPPGEKADM